MDPALQEMLDAGEATDEVAVVVRLLDPARPPEGLRIVAQFGQIATARVQRFSIRRIWDNPSVLSLKAPRWYSAEDLIMENVSLIDPEDAEQIETDESDHRRPDGIAETGRGTVIGVIDWGCDFAHPDFITAANQTRLAALWDQRAIARDGNRYGYGIIHDSAAIDAALRSGRPYERLNYHPARSDTGVGAHGTHVLGIAAGNGGGGGPLGVAPEASLAFVHLGASGWEKAGSLGDSTNLLEAIDFLVTVAAGRPLVINMSIGRHAGPHDGTTLVEQALDWLVRDRPGTCVVQSTGNYFARNVHSCGRLRNGQTVTLPFQVRPGDTTPNELEIWYPGHDVFGVRLLSPGGEETPMVPLGGKETVSTDGRRVATIYHRARDPNNGDNHINLFQYASAPAGLWTVVLRGIDVSDGRYHAWLERDPGCRICQALFPPEHIDSTSTTGSICNGLQNISVGAYDPHRIDRPLAPFSSSGPTRDGRIRPLLLAPGVRILAARSRTLAGDGPLLCRMSGTSMAAPHVAGTIALMYEAAGRLDIVRLREALLDSLTPFESIAPDDSDRTGYGYLDIAGAVSRSAEIAPATGMRQPATQFPAVEAAEAADPETTNREKENAMSCGDACKTCEHCRENSPETCPCCHSKEDMATVTVGAAQASESEPGEGHGGHVGFTETFTHPVDAAEALLGEGVLDPGRFIAECLEHSGLVWPAENTPAQVFDTLVGRRADNEGLAGHFGVIGRPGRQLDNPLRSGDIVIRRGDNGFAHIAIIAHPVLYREEDALTRGLLLEGPRAGFFAHVVEPGMLPRAGSARFARRLVEPGGAMLRDTLVLRARGQEVFTGEAEQDEATGHEADTRWLQSALNGATGAGLVVDGIVGPATRAAIRSFQAANGLAADGIVGPLTLEALRRYGPAGTGYGPPPTYPAPRPPYAPPYEPPPAYEPPQPPPGYRPPQTYEPPRPSPYRQPPSYQPPQPPPSYRPPRGYRPYRRRPDAYIPPAPEPYEPPGGYGRRGYTEADEPAAVCRTIEGFGYDSAVMTPAQRTAIGELAQRILAAHATTVDIVGHTSPEGPADYNLSLGQRRGTAAAEALRQAMGRTDSGASARIRFNVTSMGEARTISAEAPRNRRVEICYREATRPVPPRVDPPRVTTRVRPDVRSPAGQAMLTKYEEIVRRMMARSERTPTSWLYQWYIHAVRSDSSDRSLKQAELTRIFRSASSDRTLANSVWDTCVAHHAGTNGRFFLPWHRMYVEFFERICRGILGDNDFMLPYWNYSDGAARALPAPFLNASGPLFRRDRRPEVNAGGPIARESDLRSRTSLSEPSYDRQGVRSGFNSQLDAGLHGTVHVSIGTDLGMGNVPWAANDPIFWLHHCNIDRLWASWNAAGRRNPTDAAWLNGRFRFIDENGRGISGVVRDFSDLTRRGISYERLEAMPVAGSAEAVEADEPRPRLMARSARQDGNRPRPISLGAGSVKVQLGGATTESEAAPSRVRRLDEGKRLFLVIRNYRAQKQPGVLYRVYIDAPDTTAADVLKQHYVGTINFFDAAGHRHGSTSSRGSGNMISIDVTDVAQRLRREGKLNDPPHVTITPSRQPNADAMPVVGDISLVEQ